MHRTIPVSINASDIFTKEIKDAPHYRRLRDTMMVSRAIFLLFSHTVPAHLTAKTVLPYYSLMSPATAGESSLLVDVLSQKDSNPVDTSDDDDALSHQLASASRKSTRDGSRYSQKVSRPSS